MDRTEHRIDIVRRMALACVVLILCVTSLSAFMRLSNAGLGCADWPACYGEQLRVAATAALPSSSELAIALARMLHRLSAVIVLVLALTMVAASFLSRPKLSREGTLALGLVVLALGLAVLGRFTPGAKLPIVAIGNVLGGFAMLALSVLIWVGAKPGGRRSRSSIVLILLLVLQIAAGVLVSAGFAGLSCTGLPDCGMAVDASWSLLDPTRVPHFDATMPIHPEGAFAHMLHRGLALVVSLMVVVVAASAWKRGHRREALVLAFLLVVQIALGVFMVLTSLPFAAALLHNLVAALMLAAAGTSGRA